MGGEGGRVGRLPSSHEPSIRSRTQTFLWTFLWEAWRTLVFVGFVFLLFTGPWWWFAGVSEGGGMLRKDYLNLSVDYRGAGSGSRLHYLDRRPEKEQHPCTAERGDVDDQPVGRDCRECGDGISFSLR